MRLGHGEEGEGEGGIALGGACSLVAQLAKGEVRMNEWERRQARLRCWSGGHRTGRKGLEIRFRGTFCASGLGSSMQAGG